MNLSTSETVKKLEARQEELHKKIYELAEKKGLTLVKCLPITDGVADIKGYVSSFPKVMWILKEAWEKDEQSFRGGYTIYDSWNETASGIRTWDVMRYVMYGIRQGKNRVDMLICQNLTMKH